MSTLSVTSIQTGNSTTDLTIATGNTNASDIIVYSNGYGIILASNSTTNAFTVVSNGNIGMGTTAPTKSLVISANAGAASSTFNGGNTFLRLSSNGVFSEPAIEFAEAGFSPTAKISSKNEGNAGGSLYFITRDTSSTTSTLTAQMRITGTGNVVVTGNTLNLGTSSIAANGYSRLPNGLLYQWGSVTATVNGTTTSATSFPTTFTALYSVNLTLQNASINLATNPGLAATITASNTTTFTWRTSSTGAAGSATIFWQAIGV